MTLDHWQLLAILALVSSSAVALTAWACGRLHAGDAAVMRAELAMLRAENEQLATHLVEARKAASEWQQYHEAQQKRAARPYRVRGSA